MKKFFILLFIFSSLFSSFYAYSMDNHYNGFSMENYHLQNIDRNKLKNLYVFNELQSFAKNFASNCRYEDANACLDAVNSGRCLNYGWYCLDCKNGKFAIVCLDK